MRYDRALNQKWYRIFTSMVTIKTFVLERIVSIFASLHFGIHSIEYVNQLMTEQYIASNTIPVMIIHGLNPPRNAVRGCVHAWHYLWNSPIEYTSITQLSFSHFNEGLTL